MVANEKVRMRDVARLAGVSMATVSAVVNGARTVGKESRLKVKEAMKALDYHPDQIARSLRIGQTHVIGMIMPDITNPFFPRVVQAAEEIAYDAGYSIILCNSNENPSREQGHLRVLFSRRVDGAVVVSTDTSSAYLSLLRQRFPVVFVDRIPVGLPVSAVCTDNLDAAHQVTQHLIELGHERIAILIGNLGLSPHAARLEGFRKAMQQRHLPVRDEYLRTGEMKTESAYQAVRELLCAAEPPTAIIASNNKLLLGLMQAIREAGIGCPQQISIVAFDDNVWTQNFSPRLTSIAQPTEEIGRQAMEMLLRQIRSKSEKPQPEVKLLKAELRVRESTAAPPAVVLRAK
jgi:LacI family transcriptional regulator